MNCLAVRLNLLIAWEFPKAGNRVKGLYMSATIPDYSLNNIDAIKRAEGRTGHFFERSSMRFFNSRVSDRVYPTYGHTGTYFVTSERNDDYGRYYTIRRAYWTLDENGRDKCELTTVGEFQQYGTARTAHKYAKLLAAKAMHPSITAMRDAVNAAMSGE